MKRINWDNYFMQLVKDVADRSTCSRTPKGSVIVKDKRIIATGYIGSISGQDHCDDIGHLMLNGHCIRTIHSEQNAIAQAARYGINVEGSTLYTSVLPCWNCFKLLVNSGIVRIVYENEYEAQPEDSESFHSQISNIVLETAQKMNFKLQKWSNE